MKLTIVWKKKVHSRYRLNGYVNLVIFRCLVVRRSIDGGVSSMISRSGSSLSLSLSARAFRSPFGIDSFRRLRLTTISSGFGSDAGHGADVDSMSIESSVIRASDDLECRERETSREKEYSGATHSLESFAIDSSLVRLLSVEEAQLRTEDRSLILSEGGDAKRDEE